MPCLLALIIFSILGIFSATHRSLAREAFDCVFRRITLRPCNSNFKEKIKSKILSKILLRSTFLARIFNKHFELLSWVFFLLMATSTIYVAIGGYNYYLYGSCNGLNQSGFCAFDPRGEHNKVTEISQTCSLNAKNEKSLTLQNVDLSTFPRKDAGSKDTIVFIGCYECDYTRKVYPDIQRLIKEQKVNYVFAHFPVKDHDNYLSEVGYCVYNQYGDKFWSFNDYLFTMDKMEVYQPDYIEKILEKFNFDTKIINECLKKPETIDIVKKQFEELKKTNLYGTPTIFINNKVFVGPKPYRVYKNSLKPFILF